MRKATLRDYADPFDTDFDAVHPEARNGMESWRLLNLGREDAFGRSRGIPAFRARDGSILETKSRTYLRNRKAVVALAEGFEPY